MFMPLREDFAVPISVVSWLDRVVYTGMETDPSYYSFVSLSESTSWNLLQIFFGGEVCLEASKIIKKILTNLNNAINIAK